jgi:hypothetical protein
VFLDAMLPRTLRAKTRLDLLESDDPAFAADLALSLGRGERFPNWTDRDLTEILPDPGDRAVLLAGVRPRGLDFFIEELPSPLDWPDAPVSYLTLSSTYERTAHTAELRGWPVKKVDAHHFFALTNPGELAQAIDELVADY